MPVHSSCVHTCQCTHARAHMPYHQKCLYLLSAGAGSLSLIGPRTWLISTTEPFCVTSICPASASSLATARVAGINGRQSLGLTFLGASLGQQLEPGLRLWSSSRIVSFKAWLTAKFSHYFIICLHKSSSCTNGRCAWPSAMQADSAPYLLSISTGFLVPCHLLVLKISLLMPSFLCWTRTVRACAPDLLFSLARRHDQKAVQVER